jgi:hypothetical protein
MADSAWRSLHFIIPLSSVSLSTPRDGQGSHCPGTPSATRPRYRVPLQGAAPRRQSRPKQIVDRYVGFFGGAPRVSIALRFASGIML